MNGQKVEWFSYKRLLVTNSQNTIPPTKKKPPRRMAFWYDLINQASVRMMTLSFNTSVTN